jgi:hypothetical protein
MKSYIKILALTLTLIVIAIVFPKQVQAQQENVSLQIFYDELSPYGQWVDYSNYGYVWIPDVGNDFEPYSTNGHWVMTDYGWTWMSDYDWGWAPFHYGRWNYDNFYGWFWVPDTEWGPAWVTWRSADGYYGWSPMESGLSINLSFGRPYNRQNDHWTFVRNGDIDRPDISQYYSNQTDRDRIILNSTVINKTYFDTRRNATYVSGPAREDVQRATGRTLKSVTVQENNRPGQSMINGQLRIFRPQINSNNDKGVRPTPSKIIDIKDVQRPSERKQFNQPRNVNQNDNNRQGRQQDNVIPQINNQRPGVPQNTNPSTPDRRQQPQQSNNQQIPNTRSTEPQNVNTSSPVRGQQPQRIITPQENNPKPTVPQNVNPSLPDGRQQPQRTANPRESNPRPVIPQNVNPSTNDRRQQPQRMVSPQNNNNGPKPVVPQNVNPMRNGGRPQQQGTVTPQNNNGRTVPAQKRPSGNNNRQQKAVKPSNNNSQQPDQTKPETEKKKPE